ncbi:hypothetical protein [Pseudomonas sp. PLMAX]|jgi:hypothetical protein|uniref:hypothetical protein n=1 Tax=Pseudomonas sp. PLMAX TaxID=2201998 RepID=UPI0038BBC5C8
MNTNQTQSLDQQAAHFVALADILGMKHYGMPAAEFDIDADEALDCIQNNVSVLEVLNRDAERFDLDRIDVTHFGVPSKADLTEDDLREAEAQLSTTAAQE